MKAVGDISASNMYDGRWMFTRVTATGLVGNACQIIGIRDYDPYEIVQIVDWLADRLAGYPSRSSLAAI